MKVQHVFKFFSIQLLTKFYEDRNLDVNEVDFDDNEDDIDLKNLIDRISPVKSEPETHDYVENSGELLDLTISGDENEENEVEEGKNETEKQISEPKSAEDVEPAQQEETVESSLETKSNDGNEEKDESLTDGEDAGQEKATERINLPLATNKGSEQEYKENGDAEDSDLNEPEEVSKSAY